MIARLFSLKIRPALLGFLIGVIATAVVAEFALYGRDLKWEREAYEHEAAFYYWLPGETKMRWAWKDQIEDVIRATKPVYTPPPTPAPKRQRL